MPRPGIPPHLPGNAWRPPAQCTRHILTVSIGVSAGRAGARRTARRLAPGLLRAVCVWSILLLDDSLLYAAGSDEASRLVRILRMEVPAAHGRTPAPSAGAGRRRPAIISTREVESVKGQETRAKEVGDRLRGAIGAALGDGDTELRLAAVRIACLLPPQGPPQALTSALQDKSAAVRAAAVAGLEHVRGAGAGELLSGLLQADRDPQVRAAAARALAEIGEQGAVESLTAALDSDKSLLVKAAAAQSLAALGKGPATGSLVAAFAKRTQNLSQYWTRGMEERLGLAAALAAAGDTNAVQPIMVWFNVVSRCAVDGLGCYDKKARSASSGEARRMLQALLAFAGSGTAAAIAPALLQSRDAAKRRHLVRVLEAAGGQEAPAALEKALTSEAREVRVAAAKALGRMGATGSTEALIAALGDKAKEVRAAAVQALGLIGSPAAVSALIKALGEGSKKDVRLAAARALATVDDPEAVSSLIAALLEDRSVRSEVAQSLYLAIPAAAELGEDVAVDYIAHSAGERDGDTLKRAVASGLDEAGTTAALALVRLGDRETVAEVLGTVAATACDASAIADAAVSTLGHREANVRRVAVAVLARFGGVAAVGPLAKILRDRDEQVAAAGANALGALGQAEAIEPLLKALREGLGRRYPPPLVRSACGALGRLGAEEGVELLIRTLGIPYHARAASAALASIGGSRVIGSLVEHLSNKRLSRSSMYAGYQPAVRAYAILTLAQLGEAAGPLKEALADREPSVRRGAAFVLGLMRDPTSIAPLTAVLMEQPDSAAAAAWAIEKTLLVPRGLETDAQLSQSVGEALEYLCSALESRNRGQRRRAAWAAGLVVQAYLGAGGVEGSLWEGALRETDLIPESEQLIEEVRFWNARSARAAGQWLSDLTELAPGSAGSS
jgi:HEAT repeat protein